jgi:hypothetical protein
LLVEVRKFVYAHKRSPDSGELLQLYRDCRNGASVFPSGTLTDASIGHPPLNKGGRGDLLNIEKIPLDPLFRPSSGHAFSKGEANPQHFGKTGSYPFDPFLQTGEMEIAAPENSRR